MWHSRKASSDLGKKQDCPGPQPLDSRRLLNAGAMRENVGVRDTGQVLKNRFSGAFESNRVSRETAKSERDGR
jgi:hypothetical protein